MAQSARTTTPVVYEDRIILFVDFLAFKEIVEETADDPEALRRLLSAMDALAEIGSDTTTQSQRVSQFSDSIVVSYRIDEVSGVFWLSVKIAVFIVFFVLVRAALVRPRYDQLMNYGWLVMLPLSLVNLLVTGAIVLSQGG